MNNITKIVIAGVVVLVVGILIGNKIGALSPAIELKCDCGSLSGLFHNQQEIFGEGIKAGGIEREVIDEDGSFPNAIMSGGAWATTSVGTVTTTAANICDKSIWSITPMEGASPNLKFPTTSTLYLADCFVENGMSREIFVHNTATTGAGILLFSVHPGSGIDLMGTSSDSFALARDLWMKLTLLRDSVATTTVFYEKYNLGD